MSNRDKLYMPQLAYILLEVTTAEYKSVDKITAEAIDLTKVQLTPLEQKNLLSRIRSQVNSLYRSKMMERKAIVNHNMIHYYYRKCLY